MLKKKIILHIHGGGFPDFYDLSTDSKQKSIINILNAANKIAVVSEYPWRKWFLEIGVIEDKLVVLNNTIEYPKFQLTNNSSRDIPLRFLYMGKLTEEKGVYDLLEVVSEHKEELENIISNRDIKNVTLLPFQPYEEISHVFSLGDVGLVISKPGVGENSVPSKTWSIMSASRPVLASFDENELKKIIEKYHCG